MSDLSGDELAAAMMAEAAGGGSGSDAKPAKSGLMPTIAAVGILTLVAVGGGAGVGMLLGGKAPAAAPPVTGAAAPAPKDGPQAAATEVPKEKGGAPVPVLVQLAPVLTNIAAPAKTMLRLEASILVRPASGEAGGEAAATNLAAEVQADTMVFLRTVDLAQIEGARGLLHLREDLLERARLRSPTVQDYLIKSLVVQ